MVVVHRPTNASSGGLLMTTWTSLLPTLARYLPGTSFLPIANRALFNLHRFLTLHQSTVCILYVFLFLSYIASYTASSPAPSRTPLKGKGCAFVGGGSSSNSNPNVNVRYPHCMKYTDDSEFNILILYSCFYLHVLTFSSPHLRWA